MQSSEISNRMLTGCTKNKNVKTSSLALLSNVIFLRRNKYWFFCILHSDTVQQTSSTLINIKNKFLTSLFLVRLSTANVGIPLRRFCYPATSPARIVTSRFRSCSQQPACQLQHVLNASSYQDNIFTILGTTFRGEI
jgi:hypothetical protein